MNLSYNLVNINYDEDVRGVINSIDLKLAKMASDKLTSIRFDTKLCDTCCNLFQELVRYRQAIIDKYINEDCLCAYSMEDLVGNVKQFLTSGVLYKVCRNTKSKPIKMDSLKDTYAPDISVVNNFDNITINNNNYNNYTDDGPELWDQSQW